MAQPSFQAFESKLRNANEASKDGEHRVAAGLYREAIKLGENTKTTGRLDLARVKQYLALELIAIREYKEADDLFKAIYSTGKSLLDESAQWPENKYHAQRRKDLTNLFKMNLMNTYNRGVYFRQTKDWARGKTVFEDLSLHLTELKYSPGDYKNLDWFKDLAKEIKGDLETCKRELLIEEVVKKMHYYFQSGYLNGNTYIQRHMDDDGFVILFLFLSIPGMSHLTTDFEIIQQACERAQFIDYRKGLNGVDRVRRKYRAADYVRSGARTCACAL